MVSSRKEVGAPGPSPGPLRVLVVEARYYEGIADELLAGAEKALGEAGAETVVMTVDGALEIPSAVALALAVSPFDAVVALGCVIRGETGHYDIVAGESSRALTELSWSRPIPVGNGILTVETEAQAWARARVAEMDKGGGAVRAALSVLAAVRTLKTSARG